MKKFLIIGPAWVGDMVMSQTLYRQLKQQHDCIIDVLAPAWTLPLLARMPEVRQGISMPLGHGQLNLKCRYKLGKSLHQEGYDEAIVLPNSWKSALVPFFAKIPRRTGFRGEMRYGLLNNVHVLDKKRYPLMIERFMVLGLAKDAQLNVSSALYPHFATRTEQVQQALTKHAPNASLDTPTLALCPGAEFGPSKRWPAAYYAEVAQKKLAEGFQVWLFGSAKDKEVTEEIQTLCQQKCLDLAGKTSLGEALDLLSKASLVISNDSGLMHIAAALSRPLIVLYGSSSPKFTPPLTDKVKIIQQQLPCSPCFERNCPLHHHDCMQQLRPNTVLEAMNGLV